jgi:hypothetical protein
MITNKYWKKMVELLVRPTKENGIVLRDESYKPSSAFDVRQLNSNNIRSMFYVTKYVTKNNDKFDCRLELFKTSIRAIY